MRGIEKPRGPCHRPALTFARPALAHVVAQTPEWRDVDAATFRSEIVPRDRPAVMRGLVGHWPAVREGHVSPAALCNYIAGFDTGQPVQTAIGPPAIQGRLFYRPDMRGFNFERRVETFQASAARILAHIDDPEPPAFYAGAVSAADCFPGFAGENRLALLDESVVPRIWAGNAVTAPTHYDMSDNIACVVAGRRCFTFFPPDQLANLYVGPLDFTPAGQPTSMVELAAPDLQRYPRFAQALAAAETAELGPGDAVFIPNLWWHHVEALEPFNILVNYWWFDRQRSGGSAFAALVHGIAAISEMPESRRQAWRQIFDHYVFQTGGDPAAHLAPEHRGMLGRMTPQLAAQLKAWLLKALQR
ncbi:MAG: cupin [Alphaproteobacteria bacterium]|nr:cupin [Alphaproteobacteria bacterium]